MSADVRTVVAAAADGCEDPHIFNDFGCGFEAPTTSLFFPTPWLDFGLPATSGITKYTALLVVSVLIVIGFWFFTTRRAKVVPGRGQSVAEMLVVFIRDQMVRPGMGKRGDAYLPLMVTLFLFILTMNVMGIIPGAQLPVTSNLAFPAVLALSIYLLWNIIGIREHGFAGHFKGKLVPGGAPAWILPVLVPIEFISNFVFRPVTHAVRLFATMFAGHMLLAVFAAAGFYLFNPDAGGILGVISVGYSGMALVGFLVFTAFELFIMGLQAYVFVLLASFYIGEAIEGAH
ncbi:F0F1 ATP synthase subunit A [Marinitenerispora sediminis]|uniref:ATP synthase subunit a n=1 Tax=Marinitenerispora sediminis TaxID=1931232 RepID=A0A368T3Z9_9ACTN|nr:F0F1 ATP synthase subunit A [Marinitenerispora sediminis]RCV56166.1 ATP synthase F0 subunit A [Marinitenerispora sediminis]RCV57508.1 ATP synthase F0 subunit A [Marinitenerispora sediminis]RCV57863.1 ATP synthase F0 subunit A [Marinitenerispora sediminis]